MTGTYGVEVALYRSDIARRYLDPLEVALPYAGAVTYNEDRTYRRALELDVVNPGTIQHLDFLAAELTLTTPDGGRSIMPLGHFVAVKPDTTTAPGVVTGRVLAYDLTYLLDQSTMPARYTVPAGTDRGAAARAVLTGYPIPASMVTIPDAGILTTSEESWPAGTSRFRIANDLLAGAGMYHVWATGDGRLRSRKYHDIANAPVAAVLSTAPSAGALQVTSDIDERPDMSRLRNQVTVIRDLPGKEPLGYTATVTDPGSPLHPEQLGERLGADGPVILADPEPHSNNDAETIEQVQADAERRLAEAASFYSVLALESVVDLGADGHQIVALDVRDGDTVHYSGNYWRRVWSIELDGVSALMTHELNRTVRWQG